MYFYVFKTFHTLTKHETKCTKPAKCVQGYRNLKFFIFFFKGFVLFLSLLCALFSAKLFFLGGLVFNFRLNLIGFGYKLSDSKAVAQLIQTYARTKELNKGKQLHAKLIRGGCLPCTFLNNHFLNMYSKCGELDYTIKLFDRMSPRNMVSWTAVITGFAHNLRFQETLGSFCQMRVEGEITTQFSLSSVLQACASLGAIQFGTQVHCLVVKCGFGCELFVVSNLTDMYSKCGRCLMLVKFLRKCLVRMRCCGRR
ncbi:putative pentatricopeptide repeat-containing protein [Spatholobus suberectus]|nr:putative pentatricopeptide repeat-containing protein [Spatholobus suberectus]